VLPPRLGKVVTADSHKNVQTFEDLGKNSGSSSITKSQLESALGRFNIMMPENAYDKFWAAVAHSNNDTSIDIADFLATTCPSKDR
jgi:hypothetical protein